MTEKLRLDENCIECEACGDILRIDKDTYYSIRNPKNQAEALQKGIICQCCVDYGQSLVDKEFQT